MVKWGKNLLVRASSSAPSHAPKPGDAPLRPPYPRSVAASPIHLQPTSPRHVAGLELEGGGRRGAGAGRSSAAGGVARGRTAELGRGAGRRTSGAAAAVGGRRCGWRQGGARGGGSGDLGAGTREPHGSCWSRGLLREPGSRTGAPICGCPRGSCWGWPTERGHLCSPSSSADCRLSRSHRLPRRRRRSPPPSSSSSAMIHSVMVISTQAKPRLLKFYSFQPPERHHDLVRGVFQLLSARPDSVSNFVEVDALFGPGAKMVYKHLATLYFVFVFDSSENELAMLDLIQVFVETLDRCFKNVCELDIVFNFNKLHTVLDEMILGGQVIETSSEEIMKSVEEIARLEKQSNTTSLIPKSLSERFSR